MTSSVSFLMAQTTVGGEIHSLAWMPPSMKITGLRLSWKLVVEILRYLIGRPWKELAGVTNVAMFGNLAAMLAM